MNLAESGVQRRPHLKELLVQVPSSEKDCTDLVMQRLNETNSKKKQQQELLLQYIDQATEKNRHPFQTFVMLYGASGDGKSSTVNHLMNAELTATSRTQSETMSVTEYYRCCNVPDLGFKDLRMSIVDTPGFGDTSGQQQDACNLWAIRKFCDKYLNTSKTRAYPNIILLCVKATENRFQGDKSSFVKNLEILEGMRIIDKQNVNIVLVLTNACSVPPKKWVETISETAKDINETLKNKLGFSARVAFIENDVENNSLQVSSNRTLLPDGTRQPDNLFLTIMEQLEDNGDQLAHTTFRQIYSDGILKQHFFRGYSVPAKIISQKGSRMDKDEKQCFDILQDISGESKGLHELREEHEKLHQENMKKKKLPEKHEQTLNQMTEAAEQKEKNMTNQVEHSSESTELCRKQTETSAKTKQDEKKLEQSEEKCEKLLKDELRQNGEVSSERNRRHMAEKQARCERKQTEKCEQGCEDQLDLLSKRDEQNMRDIRQKMLGELKDRFEQKELPIVQELQTVQEPEPICTTGSRQQTAKKKTWYKRLGKSFTGMVTNLALNGLVAVSEKLIFRRLKDE